MEEAIGHVLIGDRGVKAIAEEYRIDRAELQRMTDLYRKGGRHALGWNG